MMHVIPPAAADVVSSFATLMLYSSSSCITVMCDHFKPFVADRSTCKKTKDTYNLNVVNNNGD